MRRITCSLSLFFACIQVYAGTVHYHVTSTDIHNGIISEKIWLNDYETPGVQIGGVQYKNAVVPVKTTVNEAAKFTVVLGKEQKKPFAYVNIPAYSLSASGQSQLITDFTLTITEKANTKHSVNSLLKNTAVTTSILASGSFYKISVPSTGLYRVDYDFLNKAGVSLSGVNISNIRVYGNGGNMLSEDNAVPRLKDLAENSIWVNDVNGDGVFNSGDFFVFYAVGPTSLIKDSTNQLFHHAINIYDDNAYYFLNFDKGPSTARITNQGTPPSSNVTVTDFSAMAYHELDLVNISQHGRTWFGEQFSNDPGKSNSQTFNFNLGTATSNLNVVANLGNVAPANGNTFTFTLNGRNIGDISMYSAATSGTDLFFSQSQFSTITPLSGTMANIVLSYASNVGSGTGYLDYIEINYRRLLAITDPQMNFRDWQSVGAGKIANFQLQGATTTTQVWDVTNAQIPVKMNGTLSGSTYSFTQDASMLHEFVALNTTSLPTPTFVGQVVNQNLHGLGPADFIIVTHPNYIDAANALATFHTNTDHSRVVVATTTQIYNEFSSGSKDISAIRDFAKMFFDNAGLDSTKMPKNLLLFGDASYDYKNRIANNGDYVPTWESTESADPVDSYASDDFFGFLDDNENIENTSIPNTLDIGVGRLPVNSETDALNVVNKVKNYKSPASLGAWRTSVLLTADNEDDAGPHMSDAEQAGYVTNRSTNLYNFNKVYIDALTVISTPGGDRCPIANQAIDGQIFKGVFAVNYTGHGNQQVWATERILTQDDYNAWTNINMLPFIITATCEFGEYDNPSYVSAGEALPLKSNGGAIVALTTTQQTYESSNKIIDSDFLIQQFMRYADGSWNTFGEAFRKSKNMTYIGNSGDFTNFRKFALLGDPAVIPDFPQYFVQNDSIIDAVTHLPTDTISALGSYSVVGSVVDVNHNLLSNFNGTVSATIYDKPRTVNTISGIGKTYQIQDNIIYKGKVSVTNGHFAYSFIAPKDINYNFGHGKISTYAQNDITDAAGSDTSLTIGGFSNNPVVNSNPPIVKPFINDTSFQNGGITGNSTLLYVELYDETGINVSGNAIGHDLTAVLDGNTEAPYILNDYYQTLPNTYKQGYVSFPVNGIADGRHTFVVTAWDVNNNTGKGSVDFEVVDGKIVQIKNLMNYPNPFSDMTKFVFEHNHPGEQLSVQINIYNASGTFVRAINQSFTATGSRSEITWDATDNRGVKVPVGVYIYKVKLSTANGTQDLGYQKAVLLR